jgi:hypothetical protein
MKGVKIVKIPDIWLVGRCQMLEKEGLFPLQALEEAVSQWLEQGRLEKSFQEEQK